MIKRLATSLALAACIGAISVSAAQASEIYQFMNHTYLETGQNYFAPNRYILYWVWGESTGVAAACVGVSGTSVKACGGEGERVSTGYIGFGGTGYLHNHSTWNSYFNAWVQGEK